MAPLANAKHEAFARAIVEGKTGRDAYRAAGYQPKTDESADAAASRLLSDVRVAARVEELKGAAAQASIMSLTEVLEELSLLGRSSLVDCIVAGDDTAEVVESLRNMDPRHARAVQEIVVDHYVEGSGDDAREIKRVRIKLHDKKGALSELRRHYEPNKHELTGKDGGPIETKDAGEGGTDLNLARRLAFLLERAARKPAANPAAKPEKKGRR